MTKKVRKEVQIVLIETIQNLGKAGSLVTVRSGFARNYLISQKKGELATLESLKKVETNQKNLEAKEKQHFDLCLKNKKILEESSNYIIKKRIGEDNKIFGKITLKQVKEIIEAKTNIDLTKSVFEIPEIKKLGTFPINIILHPTIKVSINFEILPQ